MPIERPFDISEEQIVKKVKVIYVAIDSEKVNDEIPVDELFPALTDRVRREREKREKPLASLVSKVF